MTARPWCFWCAAPGRLTRDHVKPRVAGGADADDNLVRACDDCQASRAVVQSYYGQLKALRKAIARHWPYVRGNRRRAIVASHRSLRYRHAAVIDLAARWVIVEEDRWGWSPTALLDLTVPVLPPTTR